MVCPNTAIFENAEDMYKSGDCDMVLIAVPHYDHPDLGIKAFRYGLDVTAEKLVGMYAQQF